MVKEDAETCWEFFECKGRFCSIYENQQGRQCWTVTSMTKFRVSGSTRARNCATCEFYRKMHHL